MVTIDLHETIEPVLADVIQGVRTSFGERLIGMYLYGSAVYGDFDPGISDLDVTTVLGDDVNDTDLELLGVLHDRLVQTYPEWTHRIEVQYISIDALQTFRDRRSRIANISPGESLHFIEAGADWLMNWYLITRYGQTMYGPDPNTFFPAISDREFVESIREHAVRLAGRIDTLSSSQAQSYTILTCCRALFTHRTGKHVSKINAARWVSERFPEWKPAINNALHWRQIPPFESLTTVDTARAIIAEIARIIAQETKRTAPSS